MGWRQALAAIDWKLPWFAPLAAAAAPAVAALSEGCTVAEALNRAAPAETPVRFVAHGGMVPGTAYESFVFETRTCPTRDNLHDFFNGLSWIRFPQAKQRLNALQASQIRERGTQGPRGAVRDAITVFDENGALLHAPEPLWAALRARDWKRLFVDLRPLWRQARLELFGHALAEQLVEPRKGLTAHAWAGNCPATDALEADEWLAHHLDAPLLATKPYAPLPVLGIPGWCTANEEPSFYDDPQVFRPPRRGNAHGSADGRSAGRP